MEIMIIFDLSAEVLLFFSQQDRVTAAPIWLSVGSAEHPNSRISEVPSPKSQAER